MTNIELLSLFQEKITPELRLNFENQIRIDYVYNRPSFDCYREALARVAKDDVIFSRSNVISYLVKQKLLNISDDFNLLSEDDLCPLMMLCIRKVLLVNHGEFKDYEDKLNFILESGRIFNFFRNYDIPDYGIFSGFPQNDKEKKIFITFLSKHELIVDPNFDFHVSRIKNVSNFECLKAELLFKIDISNYQKEIENEKNSYHTLIDSDLLKEYRLYSFSFFKHVVINNLNFEEFLLLTDDPLIYYIVLFFKHHSLTYVKYIDFLEDVNLANYEKQLGYYTINQFNFIESESRYTKLSHFDDKGLMIITGPNDYLYALKKLIGIEISKSDFKIIFEAIGDVGMQLNEIDNHSFESHVEKTLKKIAKRNIAVYNLIQSDEIKAIFFSTFIEYLQSLNTNKLNSIRIAYIKSQFDNHLFKDTVSKSITTSQQRNEEIQKIKTSISAKQLALLIRLLLESEIIDKEKHKIEPLLKLVSNFFSSVEKENLSVGSLQKNYYEIDYSDLLILKSKFDLILKNIKTLQEKY